jgi:hypothetical protein
VLLIVVVFVAVIVVLILVVVVVVGAVPPISASLTDMSYLLFAEKNIRFACEWAQYITNLPYA